jgi:hypothetical protein
MQFELDCGKQKTWDANNLTRDERQEITISELYCAPILQGSSSGFVEKKGKLEDV